MIDEFGDVGAAWFRLTCDYCGEACEDFDTFDEAVAYKVDRDNGWASVRDSSGEWYELCPQCNKPEVIAHIKGIRLGTLVSNTKQDSMAARLAKLASEDFEGF
jgi:hypothetical protein